MTLTIAMYSSQVYSYIPSESLLRSKLISMNMTNCAFMAELLARPTALLTVLPRVSWRFEEII